MMTLRFIPLMVFALVLAFAQARANAVTDPAASTEEAVHQTTVPEHATSSEDPAGPAFDTAEAENPVHAAEEHGEGGLPQLNIATYPSQMFWLLVMFAVLYTAFSKSVLPMIGNVVEGREALIKGNLDEAERLKKEAQAVQDAYEKNLETARAEAIKAVLDVELAAKKKAADQLEVFRHKADKETAGAETRVMSEKDKVMGQMSSVAADVASVAAEKITGVSTDAQNVRAIVDNLAAIKAKAA